MHSAFSLSENFQMIAQFGLSKKNRPTLLIENYTFVCDAKGKNRRNMQRATSWRCSMYVKYACRARAQTKSIDGNIRYRIKYPFHTH